MLDARRESYAAPGALAVVRLGGTEWAAASGAADLAGTPLDDQARFRIASITKPIVAALVVDAVGRGELGLDDIVGDLVPGLLRPDPPVTVRQLLDHTSGIFDTSNEGDVSDVERLPPALRAEAEELWRRYTDGEAVVARAEIWVALAETRYRYFEPGTDYHYSNTNYQLVGLVLEAATGRSLDALLRERIVEPLGLTWTTLAPFDAADPELRGYDLDAVDGTLVDVTGNLFAFANGGNGGIISTASELLTIMQAIAQGRFATPELLADQTAPNRANYGLGIATYALACGASALGHEGSVNGTRSIALVSPDGRDGVVIAFNLRSESDPLLPYLAGRALCWR
jgi:D-alanyl-D-alanine carboxypeptidase